MQVAVFSTKPYDQEVLEAANGRHGHHLAFFEPRLVPETAGLAAGFPGVCAFVNDDLGAEVLGRLHAGGTRYVALRSAGFNNVDLAAAARQGLKVARVPGYSPHAVAEHTVGLMLTLNRRLHRAYNRVREGNFSLVGLLGFEMHGQTVGVVGTGQIGAAVVRILLGFGCRVLAHDPFPDEAVAQLGATYVPLPELFARSDILTLHCPLTPQTRHLIDDRAIGQMKRGVMIINTSRGAVIDTPAVIAGLKSGQVGYLGIDVYEEEEGLFFEDLSDRILTDDVLARLLTFPNVIVTGHQGFFTRHALEQIARTTLQNLSDFEAAGTCANEVAARPATE